MISLSIDEIEGYQGDFVYIRPYLIMMGIEENMIPNDARSIEKHEQMRKTANEQFFDFRCLDDKDYRVTLEPAMRDEYYRTSRLIWGHLDEDYYSAELKFVYYQTRPEDTLFQLHFRTERWEVILIYNPLSMFIEQAWATYFFN